MTIESVMFNNNFLVSKDSLNRHGVSQSAEQKAMSFFSMIRDDVQPDRVRGDAVVSKGESRLSINPGNKKSSDVVESSQSSIEGVRRAFLAKGVSLDQVTLDQNDLKKLRLILDQFDFPPEGIDGFFQGIMENYSDREMTLSDFFRDFNQFEADLKNASSSHQAAPEIIFLDKASVPQIESALRDLGVTPETMDSLLPSVIDQNGNVNLEKLTHRLKKIQSTSDSPALGQIEAKHNSVLTPPLVEALEIMGLSDPDQSLGAPFSMDDLIGLMETKVPGTNAHATSFKDQTSVVLDVVADISAENRDMLWGTNRFKKNVDSTFSLSWGKSNTSDGAKMIAALNGAAVDGKGGVSKEVDGLIDDILLDFGDRMERMDKQATHKTFHMDTSLGSEKNIMAGQGNTSTTESLKPMTTLADNQLPSNVVESVGKEIFSFLQRGDRILKFQLKPLELGTVTIEMDTRENIVKLSVVAQTSAAKELFMSNHNDLRRVLEEHGVKLEGLDLQMSSDFDQSMANENHNFDRQNQGGNRKFRGIESVMDDGEIQQVQSMRVNKDGVLDLLV